MSSKAREVVVVVAVVASSFVFGARPVGAQSASRFVPVSDEMLQNPDPDDWLMWRRTLNSWATVLLTRSIETMSIASG